MPLDHTPIVSTATPPLGAALHAPGGGAVLAAWDAPVPVPARGLVPLLDGAPAPRPYTTLTVPTAWGGGRTLCLLGRPGAAATVRVLDAAGRPLAEAAGAGHGFDPAALLGGLDARARLRVVRFLLEFGRSTAALRHDRDFLDSCRRLLLELSPNPAALPATAALPSGLLLCEGALPAGFGAVEAALTLNADAIDGLPVPPLLGAAGRRGAVPIACVIDRATVEAGALLVLIGRGGLAVRRVRHAGGPLPGLLERLGRTRGAALPLRHRLATALAGRAPQAVREMQALLPIPKRQLADAARPLGCSIDLAVPTGDGGIFLAGWLHDPHGLAAGLTVTTAFGEERRLDALPHRFAREDVAAFHKTGGADRSGFAAFLPGAAEPAPSLQVTAELRLASGGRVPLVPPPRPLDAAEARAAVLGAVPPGVVTDAFLRDVLAPAVSPLHAAHLATRRPPDVVRYGQAPAGPAVSVLIPLYRNLEFLRFQMAAFATDPAMEAAELVFVLDSPEQREEVEHALHGFFGLYRRPMTLVVQSGNFGYSAANNAGAAVAAGRHLLFLNSDVVPDRPGWLPELVAALEADAGTAAVGPKLLFDDDSLQHAGLYFTKDITGRWYNQHYHKGLPRDYAPACVAREVPGVTGACLLMRRDVFEAVGGFTEDYVIGDFEDSDLCLKARAAGHAVRYAPAVELYHLERRSILRHAGYTRGVASLYNGWLHANRWAPLMEELMARDWAADPASPRKTRRRR